MSRFLAIVCSFLACHAQWVTIDVGDDRSHRINPHYLGCHSDSGFTHQVRGFSSQMIFGESFEAPQANCTPGRSSDAWSFYSTCHSCGASSSIVNSTVKPAMHGASSRRLAITSAAAQGPTIAALRNRGLGNEGLYLEGGKPYEGFFFARCAAPVTLVVRLEDYRSTANALLAEKQIAFGCGDASSDWVRVNFELTPNATAACEGIAVGSDPHVHCTQPTNEAGHSCVRCAGQFVVGLSSVGTVDIDYVVLQPGAWGRLAGADGHLLPVRLSTAQALQAMGISALRVGGSFASVTGWPDGGGGTPPSDRSGTYYQWQRWTGPPWLRPSVGAVWDAYAGTSYSLIGGWGPFEVSH